MRFRIEFYSSEKGNEPVREFLDDLKETDIDDFSALLAGLDKLRRREYHREPLSKNIGDGLFELRHIGKLNTRILYFFMRSQRVILLHGIRNKGRRIPGSARKTALSRKNDWLRRYDHG